MLFSALLPPPRVPVVTTTSWTSPRKPEDDAPDWADDVAGFLVAGGADAAVGAAAVAAPLGAVVVDVEVCAKAVPSANRALMAKAIMVRPGRLARSLTDLECKFPFCITDMFCS
jgi:hypothetical protein